MRKTRIQLYSGILIVYVILISMVGCVHRQGSTQPVTPYEKLMAYNDILAQTNKNVGEGVMQLSPGPIPLDKGRAIITAQRKIAVADQKLTNILNQGLEYSQAHVSDINTIVSDLQTDAVDLVNSGVVGVKNPQTQNDISSDINLVSSLVKTVVGSLQAAGVIK